MRVGDTVRKTIACSVTSRQMGTITPEELIVYTGKVVFVHPKGRFYTAEFAFRDGTIRECYRDGEDD
jgi:hypothetical protein